MTIKTDILRDLQGDLMDSDHVTRRLFRCWLDGSYLGEHHMKSNVAELKALVDEFGICNGLDAAIDRWVIPQFVKYTAHDAKCSYAYAQKVIVEHFKSLPNPESKDLLFLFTSELGKDAVDTLIEDYLNEVRDTHNKQVLNFGLSENQKSPTMDDLKALGVAKVTWVPAEKGAV